MHRWLHLRAAVGPGNVVNRPQQQHSGQHEHSTHWYFCCQSLFAQTFVATTFTGTLSISLSLVVSEMPVRGNHWACVFGVVSFIFATLCLLTGLKWPVIQIANCALLINWKLCSLIDIARDGGGAGLATR